MSWSVDAVVGRVLAGEVRAAARLMRWVDDDLPEARAALDALFPHTGHARLIGITGTPGAGKSTLVNALIGALRARGKTIGVVAVDPTSPFSGGAILGDRIRMQEHALDPGVFIRSVATRGNLGGLSRSTPAIVQILDAMRFDLILIETVGVGQDEIDIVRLADTSVVVNVPGLGDDIQASKAGVLEIADILVVNKADRDGAKRLRRELQTMLELSSAPHDADAWRVPILDTIAPQAQGVDALCDALLAHLSWLDARGLSADVTRARLDHFIGVIATARLERLTRALRTSDAWRALLEQVRLRERSPDEAADQLLQDLVTRLLSAASADDKAGSL